MKRIFLSVLFIFCGMALSFSDIKIDKIAIINIQLVMETVFSGKSSVIIEIKKEREDMQNKLDQMLDNIKKIEKLNLAEKDSSKKIAYEDTLTKLKKEYSDYYKIRDYEIKKKIKNIQEPLLKEIKDAVKKIAETEGYTMVFDIETQGLFYYSVDVDITQKVIDFFNKSYSSEQEKPQ